MELCQFRHGVGLLHETFHTERRKESNHGGIRTLCCHMLSRAAEGPAPPGKTDNHHRYGADDYTPHPWFNPLRYLHELLPYFAGEGIFSQRIQPGMNLQSILGVRVGDV